MSVMRLYQRTALSLEPPTPLVRPHLREPARPVAPARRQIRTNCGSTRKKESKRLANTLRAHRKRLERMLATPAACAAPAKEEDFIRGLADQVWQLQNTLAGMQRTYSGSSSSSSDSDDGPLAGSTQMHRIFARPNDASFVTSSGVGSSSRAQLRHADAALQMSRQLTLGAPCWKEVPATHFCSEQHAASGPVVARPAAQEPAAAAMSAAAASPAHHDAAGTVLVCQGKGCKAAGSVGVLQAMRAASSAHVGVQVVPCKCMGRCKKGTAVQMKPAAAASAVAAPGSNGATTYTQVSPSSAAHLLRQHFG